MIDGYGKLLDRAAGLVVAEKTTVEEMGPAIRRILARKALREGLITPEDCKKLGISLDESQEKST